MSLNQNRRHARPYAQALFHWGLEHNKLSLISNWIDDLCTLYSFSDVQKCIQQPGLDRSLFAQTIIDILKPSDDQQPLAQWLMELIMAKRMNVIPAIAEWLHRAIDHHHEELHIEIRTAHELSDQQWFELTQMLHKRLKQHIIIHSTLDPALIGGLHIQYQDNCLDASILNQLTSFQRSLHATGAPS